LNLPDLFSQTLYGRVAWTVVLGAVVLGLMALRHPPSRRTQALVLVSVAAAMLLPGAWSPAHWIGLAFQRPSAFAVALCLLSLEGRWAGRAGHSCLPVPLAAALALAGGLLYLDASGWLARGLYPSGFGPVGAPLAGLALAAGAAVALSTGRGAAHAVALLATVLVYAWWRLPTGNLWDALIDPFVWLWAVAALLRRVRLPQRRSRPRVVSAEPATVL